VISEHDLTSLAGGTVYGPGNHKIGKIVDVYESTDGGTAGTFVTVSTGLFGSHASFVPLAEASRSGDSVQVPYDKELVKDAPRVDNDEELTSEEEDRLYAHYRLGGGPVSTTTTATTTAAAGATGRTGTVGRDTSGATTDTAMTRSEERVRVGTQQVETGTARLRKRIISEQQTVRVPVSHDEVRVVREPITDANAGAALAGPELSEEEHEVVLRQEKPVVTKETVPVERVRLGTQTVTEQVQVQEQVRKEQIEVDGDIDTGRHRS